MEDIYPPRLRKVVNALFNSPAVCSISLRKAVESYAAQQSGGTRPALEIPTNLVDYVEKVTHHAYTITDQDVQQLREAGYSEDAIFEITLCATMGASLARLERGLFLLNGEPHASTNP